jgi:uncharacterized protein YeeX (DUF496 family)
MPLAKYFGGHGEEVASDMQGRYGSRWKEVFYATENARKQHKVKRDVERAKKKRRDAQK